MKYDNQKKLKTKRPITISPSIIRKTKLDINDITTPCKSSFPSVLNSLIYQSPLVEMQSQGKLRLSSSQKDSLTTPIAFKSLFTKFLPPQSKKNQHKKTLLLDLDETLVHSSFVLSRTPPEIVLDFKIDKRKHIVFVAIRPGVELFLEKMHKRYELVIFTASVSDYADPLIDQLDKRKRISHRLFRENCTFTNNTFIKDLQKLNRDLKDVILLDNSPAAYSFSKSNGFPISTWMGDKEDKELMGIMPVLNYLAKVSDVRSYITHMNEHNDFSLTRASEVDDESKGNNLIHNTNLKQIIETSNENTEREGILSSLSKRKDKKYNIKIVNNNYLQVYIDSMTNSNKGFSTSSSSSCCSTNNQMTSSANNFEKFATQFRFNSNKLQKMISQYKPILPTKKERTENNDDSVTEEEKRLMILNRKNSDFSSNRILNPLIGKSNATSLRFKLKSKRLLEIDSFRSRSKSNNNNINIINNSSRMSNIKFTPSKNALCAYQITPMMNQTNQFKLKMLKCKSKNRKVFLDDPFLKQGWSTCRSINSVFKSKSCINFNALSSLSHKLKYGILLRTNNTPLSNNGLNCDSQQSNNNNPNMLIN